MKRIRILFLLLISIHSIAFCQLFGGGIIANPQTESIGLEIRGVLPISFFQISPQVAYFPFFNKVSEVYLGVSAQVPFYTGNSMQLYGLGNASYDFWMNYADSPMKNAKPHNFASEFGIGIVGQRCISPFAEFRYDLKWRETNARIGILFDLSCGGGGGYHSGVQRAIICPGR